MKKTYAGIVGSPVTPFKQDNSVDFGTFGKQIDFLIASGVSAVVHPMHIAESASLLEEERRQLGKALVSATGGRVPVFVNVSFAGTDLSIEMAKHAAQCGATGVVLLAPYNRKVSSKALVQHFEAVANAAGGRIIAYNNREASGTELTPSILEEMLDRIPGFAGIKDASLNMETFADICALIAAKGRDIAALTASEHLLPSIAVGGDGCVSGCSEFAPRLVHALYQACLANDVPKARELQRRVGRLLKIVSYNYPVAVKHALEVMGRPVGLPRRPLQPLTPEEKAWVRAELAATGVLESEQRGWA